MEDFKMEDYISVKEVASKFEISERRVQKLCETKRIKGAKMVSGVWIIPSNVKKPTDERLSASLVDSESVTLKELCSELGISIATGRNWIKLGKIIPKCTEKGILFFSKKYVHQLKKEIQDGTISALKSRRNKKFASGTALYHSYVSEHNVNVLVVQELLEILDMDKLELGDNEIQILVADCAIKLFAQKLGGKFDKEKNYLLEFLEGKISFGEYDCFIKDLIEDVTFAKRQIEQFPKMFEFEYIYEEKEDILGLLYISCKNFINRKATGSYYTPTKIVRKLVDRVFENNPREKDVFDPCCGTGNFLLQLPDELTINHVYGNDIDAISIKIARINMALRFTGADVDTIYSNITNEDYLSGYKGIKFDFIIGNPPWGYSFTEQEVEFLKKNYKSAKKKNIESYDVFVEKALLGLKKNGVLSFVIPEAMLNVKSHMPIREYISENSSIQYIEFLGNVFDKVQCPCIILQLQNTGKKISSIGMTVNDGKRKFQILMERNISPENFSFTCTDEEYDILKKVVGVENVVFLKNNAKFALGIVTGDNKKYISKEKKGKNEIVLKGADLCKYRFKAASNYIIFQPENFQQIAPTEYYRAPEKLLYRFICDQLVFAYDNKQTLSLNSCNIVIPNIVGIEIKYILAILNSRVVQYIYKKQFNSVKVLRSHIEQIPIPKIEVTRQQEIIAIINQLLTERAEQETEELYEELDDKIRKLYGIDDREYRVIKNCVDGNNKFLL